MGFGVDQHVLVVVFLCAGIRFKAWVLFRELSACFCLSVAAFAFVLHDVF